MSERNPARVVPGSAHRTVQARIQQPANRREVITRNVVRG
jgi:hypothetical protein